MNKEIKYSKGFIKHIDDYWSWILVPMGIMYRFKIKSLKRFKTKKEAQDDCETAIKQLDLTLYKI